MVLENLISYSIQLVISLVGLAFVLGKYKTVVDHQNKVIDEIGKRVDAINTEFTFMKGWLAGKSL